jgi:glycosyltransferase involved in cell wall biosynthesis
MGKYSVELIASLSKIAPDEGGWEHIELILSDLLPKDPEVEDVLSQRAPNVHFTYLNLKPNSIDNYAKIAKYNRAVLNSYLSKSKYYDFMVLSMMQGEICPVYPYATGVRKHLLFYDLIPLMFHDIYLKSPITRMEYLSKIREMLEADNYYAISKTVANDLALYLGIDRERIVSIDGGPIAHANKAAPFNIEGPYILMPTGNDLRKNNKRAILAFDQFNKANQSKFKLVITSFFKDFEVVELSKLSDSLVFTGNISGEQLSYLYENAEVMLFPPEYEGLGLPILEAIEKNKPVACSDISVFREMTDSAFHFFDPYSVADICDTLMKAAKSKVDSAAYQAILKKYTWGNTAKKLVEAASCDVAVPSNTKVAVFGPNPSISSVAGKLMQSSHSELTRQHHIDYFVERNQIKKEPRINYLPYVSTYKELHKGLGYDEASYGAAIYHLENSADLANQLIVALSVPGIVVLYDTDLTLLWESAAHKGLLHKTRLNVESQFNKGSDEAPKFITSLVARSKAFVVFDQNTKQQIEKLASEINPDMKVECVNFPVLSLKYASVLPEKKIELRKAGDDTKYATDYQNNEALARTRFIAFDRQPKDLYKAYEAMAFGVAPYIKKTLKTSIPESIIVRYESKDRPNNQSNFADISLQTRHYIEARHGYRAFENVLKKIVKEELSKVEQSDE